MPLKLVKNTSFTRRTRIVGKEVEGGRWSIPELESHPRDGELAKGSWYVDCTNCGRQVLVNRQSTKCYFCEMDATKVGVDATKKVKGAQPLQELAESSTSRPESRRHMPLGRPRVGEWRKCKGCGKDIYVRRYRLEQGEDHGEYCKKCYGKYNPPPAPKRKEVKIMITPEERADFQEMSNIAKGSWIKAHLEEIVVDIRSMTRKQVFKKWPFGESTLRKIMQTHTPELIGEGPGRKPRVAKEEEKPAGEVETTILSEHEQLLILQGYQMAVREYLSSLKGGKDGTP